MRIQLQVRDCKWVVLRGTMKRSRCHSRENGALLHGMVKIA
ncbi:hypothetical protein [Rickettsia endosymbiont of Orchestes rusci]